VGKITRLEKKTIDGEKQPYLRVKGSRYDWWIDVEHIDEIPIRTLRKPSTFKRALRVLKAEAEELPREAKERKKQIRKTLNVGSPAALCRLIRDLTALGRKRRLSDEDKRNLEKFQNALLEEWHLTLKVSRSEAAEQLDEYLAESRAQEQEDET
jgi:RNA polymerase-interacting CarD/CdnL/TRCF family regulator